MDSTHTRVAMNQAGSLAVMVEVNGGVFTLEVIERATGDVLESTPLRSIRTPAWGDRNQKRLLWALSIVRDACQHFDPVIDALARAKQADAKQTNQAWASIKDFFTK
jgi:hypothetical protein